MKTLTGDSKRRKRIRIYHVVASLLLSQVDHEADVANELFSKAVILLKAQTTLLVDVHRDTKLGEVYQY